MKKFFTLDDQVVSVHRPRALVATALAQGAESAALFAHTGLTPNMLDVPETRLSYAQLGALALNALRLTGNPAFGIDVGRNTRFAQLGVLGLAVMSSATAGESLQLLLRHGPTLMPALDLTLTIEGELARLRLRETIALGPLRRFATEWWLASFATVSEEVLGEPWPVHEVRFDFAAPAYAARYRELYGAPLHFDCSATEVLFDASVLARPLAHAEPVTARIAERSYVMTSPAQPHVAGLLDQVRRTLDAARGRPPRLRELARELQTSARTLNRELQGMGTSYRQLLDASRRGRAIEWVQGSDMTTVQIASELGFSDVRGFRRAFKRWTGELPTSMRLGRASGRAPSLRPRA